MDLAPLNSAQASVVGGGDTLDFVGSTGNAASLYSTGGNWDTVNGSMDRSPERRAGLGGGRHDTIDFCGKHGQRGEPLQTGGNWDLVNGSNGLVALNARRPRWWRQ